MTGVYLLIKGSFTGGSVSDGGRNGTVIEYMQVNMKKAQVVSDLRVHISNEKGGTLCGAHSDRQACYISSLPRVTCQECMHQLRRMLDDPAA